MNNNLSRVFTSIVYDNQLGISILASVFVEMDAKHLIFCISFSYNWR